MRELRTAATTLAGLTGDDYAQWRLLASQRPYSGPLVDAPWVRAWTEAFVPREPFLLCAFDGRHLVGIAALQRVVESWQGRRIGVLQSRTNAESFRFDFLSWERRIDILERMWRALGEGSHWDVIRIQHLPAESPTITAALAVARASGWRPVVRPTFLTPWRPLCEAMPWDEGLTGKFRANLRRRERRLAELGDVGFNVATGGAALRQALEVFYGLEALGWKGQGGTAVAQRPQVKRFYDGLVHRAHGEVWVPVLTVCGRPIAAQVLRVSDRTMFGLKTAYDQAYAKYAPGQLLTSRVIRYGLERRMEAFDFMAANATYKADWTQQFRLHHELLLFAPSLAGRYAYWMCYGIRERLKRVPGLVPLARWLRTERR